MSAIRWTTAAALAVALLYGAPAGAQSGAVDATKPGDTRPATTNQQKPAEENLSTLPGPTPPETSGSTTTPGSGVSERSPPTSPQAGRSDDGTVGATTTPPVSEPPPGVFRRPGS